jgi:low affinity Fe/Cu permease
VRQVVIDTTKAMMMRGSVPTPARTSQHQNSSKWFSEAANATASWAGRPAAFVLAASTVVVWAVTGPIFNYSDTWQLVINTGTTIVTFLMVFLIQNTQNRDTMALQLKLDELIVAIKEADNDYACIEDRSDDELRAAHERIKEQAKG